MALLQQLQLLLGLRYFLLCCFCMTLGALSLLQLFLQLSRQLLRSQHLSCRVLQLVLCCICPDLCACKDQHVIAVSAFRKIDTGSVIICYTEFSQIGLT